MYNISWVQAQETNDCTCVSCVCMECIFEDTLPVFKQSPLTRKMVLSEWRHSKDLSSLPIRLFRFLRQSSMLCSTITDSRYVVCYGLCKVLAHTTMYTMQMPHPHHSNPPIHNAWQLKHSCCLCNGYESTWYHWQLYSQNSGQPWWSLQNCLHISNRLY